MLRYAITDRHVLAADEHASRLARAAASFPVDYFLIRERDLSAGELVALARRVRQILPQTKVLLSSRADIALAADLPGVHLTSHPDELTPTQVRLLYAGADYPAPIVSVSCHTLADIARIHPEAPELILFAPVFGKRLADGSTLPGAGLAELSAACRAASPIPVLALGGVTQANTEACLDAGAAGVAAIRLFLQLL